MLLIFFVSLVLKFTLLSLPSLSQILGNQPYFRGILSSLPYSGNNREFLPTSGDINSRPMVKISDGYLQGFTLRTVNGRAISAFQSIPFAQPPVGPLRFKDPLRNKPWKGTLDAFPKSPQCIQMDFVQLLQVHGQEDCLYLNVYTPQGSTSKNGSLPVMVFIHGGAFFYGSGAIYGPQYLLTRDIVLVTINYRLGPFGFLSTGDNLSPGNQGMKDQVMALKWVQRNIAAFGGNPNSVTIFGESCGGTSVGLHIVSPSSKGLFHRAISQSYFCYRVTRQNATDTAKRFSQFLYCPSDSSKEMVECLRKVPANTLAIMQLKFYEWLLSPFFSFAPTIEHNHSEAFITKSPEEYYEDGEAANVTWISGINSHEMGWMLSAFIHELVHVTDINRNWDRVGPIFLALDRRGEGNVEIARKIWDFYMGNKKLAFETRHEFSRLFGDRYVTECTLKAMRYHSLYTKQPVYAYHLTYQGRYSVVQQFGGKPEDWGVTHLDELIYLFNNPSYYSSLRKNDPEMNMSNLMTNIWSNFATFNKPFISEGRNDTQETWKPMEPATNLFSPIRFLDLKLNPEMINDPFLERYKLWRKLIH